MEVICDKEKPNLAAIILVSYLKSKKFDVKLSWGEGTIIKHSKTNFKCTLITETCRLIARLTNDGELYGNSVEEKALVDTWLSYAFDLDLSSSNSGRLFEIIDKRLKVIGFLVGERLTIADVALYAALRKNEFWKMVMQNSLLFQQTKKWYSFMEKQKFVMDDIKVFDDVVVRFPPEASGYLHIGHAKAALINQYYQKTYNGKLILRFDDTNPAKENTEFEKVILEDVKMLEIYPDQFTFTSDYFDFMIECCEKLLNTGFAYCDDTTADVIKQEREAKIESVNRDNAVEKNMQVWQEMKKGTPEGLRWCVRAKINMGSLNGCMRDPTIYRCKLETHPRTGTNFKVYPTYDFACPIVDSIEGVTLTLRTSEYHDRDEQFYWFIDTLNLRKPIINEFSRLCMTNTVLSKRKLTWFVENGLVEGWDDPRFPTVRGILRRGMTVGGLRQFIESQGSSRSVVLMEWDKIWAINKKIIDPIAPRFTVLEEKVVPVHVKSAKRECLDVAKHPKNPQVGTKKVWTGQNVLIEFSDAKQLKENENATFINWGNILITKIHTKNGEIVHIDAETNLDNKDFKKTLKLTWLCETEEAPFTPGYCVSFDHIISKPSLGKEDNFEDFVKHQTKWELKVIGDPELKSLKKGDIIQLQRKGFYIVDVAYSAESDSIDKVQPIILFSIPDGHTKDVNKQSKSEESKNVQSKVDNVTSTTLSANDLSNRIAEQGDKVRKLKSDKAEKSVITAEVKVLLELKAEFKKLTGNDWKPAESKNVQPKIDNVTNTTLSAGDLSNRITEQGDKVRKLKSDKTEKSVVAAEVKELLEFKAEFKKLTGHDWKPEESSNFQHKIDNIIKITLSAEELSNRITEQGDNVRKLKSDNAEKARITVEVKELLKLKSEFKKVTGNDWKPAESKNVQPKIDNITSTTLSAGDLSNRITEQGDNVRKLKSDKAEKSVVAAEVKELLEFKAEFKKLTGNDWKPEVSKNVQPKIDNVTSTILSAEDLSNRISEQGDKVRKLKSDKAEKSVVAAEVKELLEFKAEFKKLTGNDWKPEVSKNVQPKIDNVTSTTLSAEDLSNRISEQGDKVRKLKSDKAEKSVVAAEVKKLLELKAEFKKVFNVDWNPISVETKSKPNVNSVKNEQPKVETDNKPEDDEGRKLKKQTKLCIEYKKSENLSKWYAQVLTKGDMILYSDISGCYPLLGWSYAIWEAIQGWLNIEIHKLGVENCYFPMLLSKSALEKEKSHIDDFSPEVAWVTKSGDRVFDEPIAIRPTSETVLYPLFPEMIDSYMDLPIKLNQWCNVLRWEFKDPQPFIRTREFLWQEGHTAYAVKADAEKEVAVILDLYAHVYTDLLAIPVIKGRKSEKEKFAGADYTYTIEAFVAANGRGIQAATSHHLGQNFSKMFDISFQDPVTNKKQFVYQNSWGLTTRSIGVMILVHGDDKGLILPPNVAKFQVVIVPCGITVKLTDDEKNNLYKECANLETELRDQNVKTKSDYRTNYSPGWKFNHWELKGIPLRVEIGPKDLENNQILAVRRDTGDKIKIERNSAVSKIKGLLDNIQSSLLQRATNELEDHTKVSNEWNDFRTKLDGGNIVYIPFCGEPDCETMIKDNTKKEVDESVTGVSSMGAKSLCIPFEQPRDISSGDQCINPNCKNKPKAYVLFGRSY